LSITEDGNFQLSKSYIGYIIGLP